MKKYPAIKFTLLFIIGILLHRYFEISPVIFFIVLAAFLIITIISLKFKNEKFNYALIILSFVSIILLGDFLAEINKNEVQLLPTNLYKQKNMEVFGTIKKIELPREYESRFILDVDSFKVSNTTIKMNLTLLTRIRDDRKEKLDSLFDALKPGYKISVTGTYMKGGETRNPGEFDYNHYLNSIGISGLFTTYYVGDVKILHKNVYWFGNFVNNVRKYLNNQITKLHDKQTTALLRGLILADRSGIDYAVRVEFINSGVIHVLAVSGLHTGYIILIFLVFFGRFNIYIKSFLTITGLIFFLVITGMPPSVFRASIMAIVFIIALLTNRSTNLFNALAIAALILLIIKPYDLFNPGFQLSFSAVLAIAAILPIIQTKIRKLNVQNKIVKYVLLFTAVSLSAQLGTLPFTIYYFGKLSLIALFANLVVIPVIGLVVGTGIFTLALNLILPSIAVYYAAVNDLFSKFLFWFVSVAGNLDFSFVSIRHFSIFDGIIFYLFLTILIYYLVMFKHSLARIILFVLITCNIFLYASIDNKDFFKKNELNVLMIDVGQGDGILLQFPNGQTALIDAGNADYYFDNGERVILPLLNYLGIKQVDYGFVSHIDADHYGGFVSLIHEGKIKQIYKPPIDSTYDKDIRFEKYLREMKVPFHYYQRGEMKIGNVNIYTLDDYSDKNFPANTTNNMSGELKIVYGKTSFLFTGDAETTVENYYVKRYNNFLKTDVLKVGHHGSNSSSSPQFLLKTKPEISLVSVGIQNKFGHPSSLIINRLRAIKSHIHRTDIEGAIYLTSDGDSVKVVDWKDE